MDALAVIWSGRATDARGVTDTSTAIVALAATVAVGAKGTLAVMAAAATMAATGDLLAMGAMAALAAMGIGLATVAGAARAAMALLAGKSAGHRSSNAPYMRIKKALRRTRRNFRLSFHKSTRKIVD